MTDADGPVVAIIPARWASERLPGKPLLDESGEPLVWHVVEQARRASVDRVIVATDDERIATAVTDRGGEAMLTDAAHATGSDRLAEVAERLGAEACAVVVNIQGDEPEIPPDHVDLVVSGLLGDPQCDVATLACHLPDDTDPSDPHAVKVVCDRDGRALYFSRSPIPHHRDPDELHDDPAALLHVGLYAYRRDTLLEFTRTPPTPLEKAERLEQLRFLETGRRIHVVRVPEPGPGGIDTRADYEAFLARRAAGT